MSQSDSRSKVGRWLRRVVLEPLFVLAAMAALYVFALLAVNGVEAITR